MKGKRLFCTLRLFTIRNSGKRADYLKKKNIFREIGRNCSIMDRSVPLYAELIKLGNNVHIASNVNFVTHDVTYKVLNGLPASDDSPSKKHFREKVGCIEIGDNVFIGSGTRVLYDVKIGSNCIIGAGSVVTGDIPENSVAAGVPARVIGTFDDFVSKRTKENEYPLEYEPSGEEIRPEFTDYLWNQFYSKRKTE